MFGVIPIKVVIVLPRRIACHHCGRLYFIAIRHHCFFEKDSPVVSVEKVDRTKPAPPICAARRHKGHHAESLISALVKFLDYRENTNHASDTRAGSLAPNPQTTT